MERKGQRRRPLSAILQSPRGMLASTSSLALLEGLAQDVILEGVAAAPWRFVSLLPRNDCERYVAKVTAERAAVFLVP